MTLPQFNSAGLQKLTPDELRALDDWIVSYGRAVAQVSKRDTPQPPSATTPPAVIESSIDGEFSGWEGETIFKLTNGQIWQQATFSYVYHYAYNPSVLIYRSGSEYRMRVEDVEETIAVRRLK